MNLVIGLIMIFLRNATIIKGNAVYLANAAFMWVVPLVVILALMTRFMENLPLEKPNPKNLVHMRIGYAVGTDKTIVTDIDIAGIKAVEVTAIGINHLTVLTAPTNGLVYKIPNETTLIFGIFANHIQYSLKPPSELPMACAYSH